MKTGAAGKQLRQQQFRIGLVPGDNRANRYTFSGTAPQGEAHRMLIPHQDVATRALRQLL